ncbi:hypothetical protein [Vibrio crassostreae]|uniref:hypothetical protein n=1 Tax=Vibrio crassostreae TaxID=246167 RepID=UPI001B314969|nr:hypothetical protein [Vibrio crassostreae]
MNIYIFKSVADATAAHTRLSKLLPMKQSKGRELMAGCMGYKSFNALSAAIKERPVLFHLSDLVELIEAQYKALAKRPPASTQQELREAFAGMELTRNDAPNFGGHYEIEFELMSPNSISNYNRLEELSTALNKVGVVTDEMLNNEDNPFKFIARPDKFFMTSSTTVMDDPLGHPIGWEFFTSTCSDIMDSEYGDLLSTGMVTLYVKSMDGKAPIGDLLEDTVYRITQYQDNTSGSKTTYHAAKMHTIRFYPVDMFNINPQQSRFNVAPAFESPSSNLHNDDINFYPALISDNASFAGQFTVERLDKLKHRDYLSNASSSSAPLPTHQDTTLSLYWVDANNCLSTSSNKANVLYRPHPLDELINIYIEKNTLHLEHVDYLALSKFVKDPSRFFNALEELHAFLSDYAAVNGYDFVSHYMYQQDVEDVPMLASTFGFYLTPIDINFGEFTGLFNLLYNEGKGNVINEDDSGAVELKLKSGRPASHEQFRQFASNAVESINARCPDAITLAKELRRKGVNSVSVAEVVNPNTGKVMSATLSAYSSEDDYMGSFMAYLLNGSTSGYKRVLRELKMALRGGCHVVDKYREHPQTTYTPLYLGSVGFYKEMTLKDSVFNKMGLYTLNTPKRYEATTHVRPLLVTLELDPQANPDDLLGKELGVNVLRNCASFLPELTGKEIAVSPIVPIRTEKTESILLSTSNTLDVRGDLVESLSNDGFMKGYIQGYQSQIASYDKQRMEEMGVTGEQVRDYPEFNRVGVIVFTSLTKQELVDVSLAKPDAFNMVYPLPVDQSIKVNFHLKGKYVTGTWITTTLTRQDYEDWAGVTH